jgi:hypothetical protein
MNDTIVTTTTTLDDTDVLEAVRESSLLADVSIAVWGATRSDPKLLNDLKAQHGASGDVGRVIKNLLAGADGPLKAVKGAYMAVRTRHYALTLPWVNDPHAPRQEGPRLLPKVLLGQYNKEISELKKAAENQLEEFLAQYPELVKRARANLGTMAPSAMNGGEYPTAEEIRGTFRLYFDFQPIPETASFRGGGLNQRTLEQLSNRLHKKFQRQTATANAETWSRIATPLRHLIGRLEAVDTDDKARFKKASVENLRKLVTLLPGWNVTGDPRISAVTGDIEKLLDGVDEKDLRENPATRSAVVEEARKVSARLASWNI